MGPNGSKRVQMSLTGPNRSNQVQAGPNRHNMVVQNCLELLKMAKIDLKNVSKMVKVGPKWYKMI